MAEIQFDDVSKVYDDGTQAVFDLNLKIEDGEFVIFNWLRQKARNIVNSANTYQVLMSKSSRPVLNAQNLCPNSPHRQNLPTPITFKR